VPSPRSHADGLAAANQVFGLTQTTPGEDGYWGSTVSTPADQVRLLAMLTDDSGPLSAGGRGYELDLMGSVESDQRWGEDAGIALIQRVATLAVNGLR
jgi:hypothetical protein